MAGSSFSVDISKVRDGVPEALADYVAVEEPLEIRLGYSTPDGRATRSVSITMRTPGNDRELAAGFLYTEAFEQALASPASGDDSAFHLGRDQVFDHPLYRWGGGCHEVVDQARAPG